MADLSFERMIKMDGIREQLVKKPMTPEDKVKKIILTLSGIPISGVIIGLLLTTGNVIFLELGVLASIVILWGGWYLGTRLNVEYEYSVVGPEFSVDKIFNKRSRKPLCSMNLKSTETFYASEKHVDGATEIDVCGEGNRYTLVYDDPSYGKTVLIFTPDELTLEAVKPYLPRAI